MVRTCPDLRFQFAKAGTQRYGGARENEMGVDWTIVRLQDEEEEGQAELERDEESENQRIWPWQIQVDD